MPELVQPLAKMEYPLANRLYKTYYKAGKLSGSNSAFIMRDPNKGHIIACVKLSLYPHYWFLSSLLVVPEYRRLGIARYLVKQTLPMIRPAKNVYCFAHPSLAQLYLALGFKQQEDDALPADLHSRLDKYRRKQALSAFAYQHAPTA